jgi:hypothetical protein
LLQKMIRSLESLAKTAWPLRAIRSRVSVADSMVPPFAGKDDGIRESRVSA